MRNCLTLITTPVLVMTCQVELLLFRINLVVLTYQPGDFADVVLMSHTR